MRLPFRAPAAAILALSLAACSAQSRAPAEHFPVPGTVSPELQRYIAADRLLWYWREQPRSAREWKELVARVADETKPKIALLRQKLAVTSQPRKMGGVPVSVLRPKFVAPQNEKRVLLHIHGGGYVFHPGDTGSDEGIIMAASGNIPVISVDYRMPPEHPYPAALDDVLAVYRELLKTYPPARIGVFGSSTGGGLTLALLLRARAEGLPLPAAIAPGSPWSDMSKTGDTYFTHEGQDNVLVSYDFWLKEAARLYANGRDLRDPCLSPVYGDVTGFPPVLLTSGTRDLFLSNTVRMHRKLREAGVPADLVVFEGMSHVQYQADPDVPEVREHFLEVGKFFNRYLE